TQLHTARIAGEPAIGFRVRVVPVVGPLVAAYAAGALDLPHQSADVVARARPVARSVTDDRAFRQCAAVVGDLGEVEAAGTTADLGQHTAGRGGVATGTPVLERKQRCGAIDLFAFLVVAEDLAGVVARLQRHASTGRHW